MRTVGFRPGHVVKKPAATALYQVENEGLKVAACRKAISFLMVGVGTDATSGITFGGLVHITGIWSAMAM